MDEIVEIGVEPARSPLQPLPPSRLTSSVSAVLRKYADELEKLATLLERR